MRISRAAFAFVGFLTAVVAAAAQPAQQPTTVLFMCPHGAGKSVLASAYFRQLAAENGIRVQTDAVGTEPGPEVGAAVAAHLKTQGLAVPIARPRAVTDADVARADIIVSIGCDLSTAPASVGSSKKLRRWDDVPDLSANFDAADKALRAKAQALVEAITRQAPR